MTTTSVKPGEVLAGKYRVERVLGAGGMGYVVAARHLQLDQLVAMKFLRKAAVENKEAAARFLREAKAVVKLRNEHIAKVFDVGTLDEGEPYIVMEYLDGADLAAMAKERDVLPVGEVCEYIIQSCEALAEAHALGIIHRDIKLANLFVTRGPAGGPLLKLLDFGISKTNPFGESEHDMTRTASMLGSPRFMSPEQMRDARAVDGRTDIWSLGVVLYRLIGGRPPFEAETLGRLLTMVMHEQEAPLSSLRPDLPAGFDHVISRCLQKDPATRFANVAELAYALVPFSYDPGRARAAADRIATMLSLPASPPAGNPLALSLTPRGMRPSSPPGLSDTPAPWAGTQGNLAVTKPVSHGAWVWLAVALSAMVLGSAIVAMVHRNAAAAHAPEAEAPIATHTPPPSPPPPAATGVTITDAPPTAILSAVPAAQLPATTAPTTTSPPRVEAAPRRAAPPARSARPTVARGARPEDGIPTTRD